MVLCKRGLSCTKVNCGFVHLPENSGRKIVCINHFRGGFCPNNNCGFIHPADDIPYRYRLDIVRQFSTNRKRKIANDTEMANKRKKENKEEKENSKLEPGEIPGEEENKRIQGLRKELEKKLEKERRVQKEKKLEKERRVQKEKKLEKGKKLETARVKGKERCEEIQKMLYNKLSTKQTKSNRKIFNDFMSRVMNYPNY